MAKVLFVSHTTNLIKFNIPYIKWLKEYGCEVHYASAEEEPFPEGLCKHFKVDFCRNPLKFQNIVAYKQLLQLMQKEHYDLVHCHTPVGGVVARLAGKAIKKKGFKTKVMYTVHGFHFFKGAPLLNWLCYYPVEKYLAKYTDYLITINDEDYQTAIRKKFKAKVIAKINGVGVDLTRFTQVSKEEREKLRKQFGFLSEDYLILCVGELNKNKGQNFLINQMESVVAKNEHAKLILLGKGNKEQEYKELAKNSKHILFEGYRKDADLFYKMSDVLVSSSHREGLPVNLLEGMACGLPVICTDVRGQRDLIKNDINGYIYNIGESEKFVKSIIQLSESKEKAEIMGEENVTAVKKYEISNCLMKMGEIYSAILNMEK